MMVTVQCVNLDHKAFLTKISCQIMAVQFCILFLIEIPKRTPIMQNELTGELIANSNT